MPKNVDGIEYIDGDILFDIPREDQTLPWYVHLPCVVSFCNPYSLVKPLSNSYNKMYEIERKGYMVWIEWTGNTEFESSRAHLSVCGKKFRSPSG